MAKSRKKPNQQAKSKRAASKKASPEKKTSAKTNEFSVKQKTSPFLDQYLAHVRENELMILGALCLLIVIAVTAFAAPQFLEKRKSPQALKTKITAMQGDRRINFLEKARDKKPEGQHYEIICCELAREYYRQGENEKALDLFRELERHFRNTTVPTEYRNIFAHLAKIYMKRSDYGQADPYINLAVKNGSYDDEFKLLLGESLLKAQRPVEAASWLELILNHATYGEKAQELMRQVELELKTP